MNNESRKGTTAKVRIVSKRLKLPETTPVAWRIKILNALIPGITADNYKITIFVA
jgi:hypothetical protein